VVYLVLLVTLILLKNKNQPNPLHQAQVKCLAGVEAEAVVAVSLFPDLAVVVLPVPLHRFLALRVLVKTVVVVEKANPVHLEVAKAREIPPIVPVEARGVSGMEVMNNGR
jgi:hypothetical protein